MTTSLALLVTLLAFSGAAIPVLAAPNEATPPTTAPSRFFLGIHDFKLWTSSPGEKEGETMLISPVFEPPLAWNELVISWNATLPASAIASVEAQGIYPATTQNPARQTKFYSLGHWSGDPKIAPRESVNGQADGDGDVQTDTLVLKERGAQLRLRLTLSDSAPEVINSFDKVRFIGLSFLDNTQTVAPRAANHAAWGKIVAVPERFQGDFRALGGAVWCSPTSVSMILEHWARETHRHEMNLTVPEVAGEVLDPQWPGTGNWAFNVAFAGSFPGVRAYVSRFDDLADLETWIAAGIPVALSVNYGLLKGEGHASNGGHLVVCNGFTPNGDVVIADPGQHTEAGHKYRVFKRADVIAGWGDSHNTVYLIYPESQRIPAKTHNWDG